MMMYYFLSIGIILGLSAGFAPGPLLTLVVSETLQYGFRAGLRVAMSPLITDAPIILLTLLVLSKLAHSHAILGMISIGGACVLMYMAYDSLRITHQQISQIATQSAAPQSLLKGALTNLLSPHPYLFWMTIGGSMMTQALQISLWALTAFLLGFYTCLVGSKVLLAGLIEHSRAFLSGTVYAWVMRFLGLALFGLALLLLYDGIKLLGGF